MRLKSKLLSLNNDKTAKTKIFSPANTEELRIPFKVEKTAKVVGQLAQIPPPKSSDPDDERLITGVLVQNDFKMSLMAPEDLREYAGLTTTTIMCKQNLTLSAAGLDLVKWASLRRVSQCQMELQSSMATESATTRTWQTKKLSVPQTRRPILLWAASSFDTRATVMS